MNQIPIQPKNITDIETVLRESPGGRFLIRRRNMNIAAGYEKDSGPWNGAPPFDVEVVNLPAGKSNFPYHSHGAVWEFHWIKSGNGSARIGENTFTLKPGDYFYCPPGVAHQISAVTEMEYLVIANNVQADVGFYPDSKKWIVMPERICFRESVTYYNGEEE